MASVVVLTADLLFGSNVQGMLSLAGHEVRLAGDEGALRDALVESAPDVVVTDLTDRALEGVQTIAELRTEGFLSGVRLLAYYSHVEPGVRDLALAEDFDLVVPRSRMAREGGRLVDGLLAP
jgi:DNA-binding response OmpR family regulator